MTYPNYLNKYLEKALFHPRDFVKYVKFDRQNFPKKMVITYQHSALDYFKRKFKGKYKLFNFSRSTKIYILEKEKIGFMKMSGIGAPHATTLLEEFIELGTKEFINIGTAGGLQHEGVFLCEKAIRDEGTSHHYLPNGKYSYPDKFLTNMLGNELGKKEIKFEKSTSWTVDAPYRETKKEIEHYRKEGVSTVEMEASALFAVAKIRKARIASAFVVSDTLLKKWNPNFKGIDVIKTQNKLIDAAIDCLRKIKK